MWINIYSCIKGDCGKTNINEFYLLLHYVLIDTNMYILARVSLKIEKK